MEILFIRFTLGLLALCAACPRRMRGVTKQQELIFAGAGLCGVCLYYLLENIALTYTLASNVGVILSVIPFFTAVLSHLFLKEERPGGGFYLGFVVGSESDKRSRADLGGAGANCHRRSGGGVFKYSFADRPT